MPASTPTSSGRIPLESLPILPPTASGTAIPDDATPAASGLGSNQTLSCGCTPADVANAAVRLEQVSVTLNGNKLIQNITAHIPRSALTCILGANGAGKTTLLRALLGLLPIRGVIEYRLGEANQRSEKPRLGYVPQRLDFDRGVPLTVLDFLTIGYQRRPIWFGTRRALKEQAQRQLKRVNAEHLLRRPLGKLSGGELQRIQLALALMSSPQIIFLDEPVSGVDLDGQRLFWDLLEEIRQREQITVVMVSHDLAVVTEYADHVLCLKNGQLHCQGNRSHILTNDTIAAVYGPGTGLYLHSSSATNLPSYQPVPNNSEK